MMVPDRSADEVVSPLSTGHLTIYFSYGRRQSFGECLRYQTSRDHLALDVITSGCDAALTRDKPDENKRTGVVKAVASRAGMKARVPIDRPNTST